MSFSLPKLPYAHNALEPHIDAKTMEIHHSKHHQTYVDKLNAALESAPEWADKPIETILCNINEVPEVVRTAVRNHGGGHYNHSLFWESLTNEKTAPSEALHDAIMKSFGSMEKFQEEFNAAATSRFGSGWAWLMAHADGVLFVTSTPNQDNPIMDNMTLTPIVGLDVWEHAYYLHYQNRRPEYITAFWNVINWDTLNARYQAVLDAQQ